MSDDPKYDDDNDREVAEELEGATYEPEPNYEEAEADDA